MAVRAQYPCNVLLLNRNEQERGEEMELPHAALGILEQPPAMFGNGVSAAAASGNPRKRMRDAAGYVPMASQQHNNAHPVNVFSMQPSPTLASVGQLQNHQPSPAFVSTGLRLSFEDQHQGHGRNPNHPLPPSSSSSASSARFSSLLPEELAVGIGQQKDEIGQFLIAQGEQLRRALAEQQQKHYRALLSAAEKSAARRLREKEAEVEHAVQRGAELENCLARLRAESMAWQTKAMADQATVAKLHAQLQQAAAAAAAFPMVDERCGGGSVPANDAESAYVDPDRVEPERASCRACRARTASVVLLPCRHLCLCEACDAASVDGSGGGGVLGLVGSCPVCRCFRSGSVRVFLT